MRSPLADAHDHAVRKVNGDVIRPLRVWGQAGTPAVEGRPLAHHRPQ